MKKTLIILIFLALAIGVNAQGGNYDGIHVGPKATRVADSYIRRVNVNEADSTIEFYDKNGKLLNPKLNANGYIDNADYFVKLLVDTLYDATTVDTLGLTDAGRLCRYNNAAQTKVYVPTNATVPFPIGTQIHIKMDGTGIVGILGCAGVVLQSELDSAYINNRHGWATIIKRATNKWDRLGSLKD